MVMFKYIMALQSAQSLDDLDYIYETAAWDEKLTTKEICAIYDECIRIAKSWSPL